MSTQKSAKRRTPVDFEGGTFEDVLVWLLKQCGSPKALVRHMCMELLETLAPHTKGKIVLHLPQAHSIVSMIQNNLVLYFET